MLEDRTMRGKWIIDRHHVAIKCDNGKTVHPMAADIYSKFNDSQILSGGFEIECSPLAEFLSGKRRCTIGKPLKAELTSQDGRNIVLNLYSSVRGKQVSVDIVDYRIIDHCISETEWVFISDSVVQIQDMLSYAEIASDGSISTHQYLKLIEYEILNNVSHIDNQVDLRWIESSAEAVPAGLRANLFAYQKDGYNWLRYMLEANKGCILGDEMGLGKTLQAISILLYFKEQKVKPSLVVAPISLLENWKQECAKFAPTLKTILHYGPKRISNYNDFEPYDVIITSYTTVSADIHMLNMLTWELVILDEAQNIKNPDSARTKYCKGIKRCRSMAITGTPFENHVTDIWSLIDFIAPGLLGNVQTYKTNVPDDINGGKIIAPILSPLMIRRKVNDVAKDLPERNIISQPIQMSETECTSYCNLLKGINDSISRNDINLGMIQKLRLFCTHPLVSDIQLAGDDPFEASVKYQRLCEILEEVFSMNEKALIFTSFKKMFQIFEDDFRIRFNTKVMAINGDTPTEKRQQIVDEFNSYGSSAVMILNPRAAGTGLNITGANHVIHYNLEWNPALEDQATARAYRRGQNKPVFIYRLYYIDTVEQIINERIERKRNVSNSAVTCNSGTSTDRDDILSALKLIPQIRKK